MKSRKIGARGDGGDQQSSKNDHERFTEMRTPVTTSLSTENLIKINKNLFHEKERIFHDFSLVRIRGLLVEIELKVV